MKGTMKPKMMKTSVVLQFAGASVLALAIGCGNPEQKEREFHTSGSREADQRAEQTIAKDQQLRGEGAGKDEHAKTEPKGKDEGIKKDVKLSLYDRLGAEKGITLIVEDWVNRAIVDPRVNWARKGVTEGGFSLSRNKSVEWRNTPEAGTAMKGHIKQFLMLSTGGPPKYEGKEMKAVHEGMHITNDEFDAAIGDLKASLDNLQVPTQEQKELLAIVESTRPQISTKR